ncbi:MAG: hypothetical protein K2N67_03835 [Mucispirillum sp.]|nr:hypothetical protein [Mucispirillum sp.]
MAFIPYSETAAKAGEYKHKTDMKNMTANARIFEFIEGDPLISMVYKITLSAERV